jgi:hypothetical protein
MWNTYVKKWEIVGDSGKNPFTFVINKSFK